MRRTYTPSALALLLSTPLLAQPTLNQSNNTPTNGAEYSINNNSSWSWAGPTGADVDFGFYDLISTGQRTYFVHDASVTSSSASVPSANRITTDGGQDTLFWNFAADGMYQVGAKTALELLSNYTDPILELKYPCTFGTTWSDITVASFNTPVGLAERTGTITGTADAYGELGLAGVVYPNVLRVKVRRNLNDVAAVASYRRITTNHYFFEEGTAWPVLKLTLDSVSINNGGFSVTRTAQWIGGAGGVGITDLNVDQVNFTPYPNPTTGQVDLGMGTEELRAVELYTSAGALVNAQVRTINGTTNRAVDLSGLPAGLYALKVTSLDGRTGTRRIVVE